MTRTGNGSGDLVVASGKLRAVRGGPHRMICGGAEIVEGHGVAATDRAKSRTAALNAAG